MLQWSFDLLPFALALALAPLPYSQSLSAWQVSDSAADTLKGRRATEAQSHRDVQRINVFMMKLDLAAHNPFRQSVNLDHSLCFLL
jgi:hypothetical protein